MTSRLPPVRNLGYVALGGAIGAVARVALAGWFPPATGGFPWVTFLENVAGAFLLALVLTRLTERLAVDPAIRLIVCTGALGAFTTYGTMALELQRLVAGGHLAVTASYAVATLVSGVLAGVLGLRIARGRPLPGVPGIPGTRRTAIAVMWLLVGAAGALGAVARYLVDHLVSVRTSGAFPWGTFTVNVSGSFAAGVVAASLAVEVVGSDVAVIVAGGFLGAYTTFSTAMYETVRLIEDGARRLAIGNLLAPLLGSVLAAAGGWLLVTALVGS